MEELEFTELGTDDMFVSMLRQTDEDPLLVLPELERSENESELSLHRVTELSETELHGGGACSHDDNGSLDDFEVVQQSTVLGSDEFQAALNTAVCTSRSFSSGLLQPWERGPMKFLFGDALSLNPALSLQAIPPRTSETDRSGVGETSELEPANKKAKALISQESVFAHCVSGKPDVGYLEKKEADKKLAVGKLASLVLMSPGSFQIGRTILEEESEDNLEGALYETIDMVMAMKSPNTLNKRAGSLLLYTRWFKANRSGDVFPILERDVAAYLFSLKRSGKYTSRGASFRESLKFSHFTLGLDGAISACDSPRVKGASDMMLSGGNEWTPADPLLTSEVMSFHKAMVDEKLPLLDRLAAGHVLVMVYGRCRASDLCHIHNIRCDFDSNSGYLEFDTRFHKTSRKASLKTKLLPIALPVVGINGENWVSKLLELRVEAGLKSSGILDAPWWPAPAELTQSGIVWSKRPVSSEEITAWINKFLEVPVGARQVSSHSAKATCLSWLSKAGVPREDRDILGRHVTALHGSGPLYARDLLSAPLRKLEETISFISGKQFMPDHNRSGMFTPVHCQASARTPVVEVEEKNSLSLSVVSTVGACVEIKEDKDDEVQIISDSDEDGLAPSERAYSDSDKSDGLQSEVEEAVAEQTGIPVRSEADGDRAQLHRRNFFRHKKSGICHLVEAPVDDDHRCVFFACGRRKSDNFTRVPSVGDTCLKCSLCFKSQHIDRA